MPSPMNPLQIQLFAGAAAGRRARFDRSPITFGRDPSNMLVIEDALVSREHGEIRFEGGRWTLVNLSSNGTRVNRRHVKDKPAALSNGDEVYVGGKLLFNVTFEPVDGAAAALAPAAGAGAIVAAGAAAGAAGVADDDDLQVMAPPRKSNLWKGIGFYLGGMAILFVVLMVTFNRKGGDTREEMPVLTREEIRDIMTKPPKKEPRSDGHYLENLNDAKAKFPVGASVHELSPSMLVATHESYLAALSCSGLDDTKTFRDEDRDQDQRFLLVRDELIHRIEKAYRQAVTDLKAGDDAGAFKGFKLVLMLVKDQANPIHGNAVKHQAIARKRIEAGKKRGGPT